MFLLEGLMGSLLEQAIQEKEYVSVSWKPEKAGDAIAGKVISCQYVDTQNGTRLLIKIDATDVISGGIPLHPGIWAVWERAQLKQIAEEKQLRTGDEVAFVFKSEASTKQGGKKKVFSAIVNHTAASGAWKGIPFIPSSNEKMAERKADDARAIELENDGIPI